jgi:hypothetical protein
MHPLWSFGYYARVMITLAAIAYADDMASIPRDVDQQLNMSVVWGPVELRDEIGISYSRAYIARWNDPDEYAVVIRGTNFISWQSWTLQDFAIDNTVPFSTLPGLSDVSHGGHVADSAAISQGTFNGMSDLLRLVDPQTGQTMVQYLQAVRPATLYVTGHSLGGTLTPPMFAYLREVLTSWRGERIVPFSFAGLSAGDTAFNRYLNSMIEPGLRWRFHNSLDIAPRLWGSYRGLEDIYTPFGVHWGELEADWLTSMFQRSAPLGYAQPDEGWTLTGEFRHGFLDIDGSHWTAQALHQHHSGTYQQLIFDAFPGDTLRTAVQFRGIRPREAALAR